MANRRLDWLVYTIMHRIVPYYARKVARQARSADITHLMAYIHASVVSTAATETSPEPATRRAMALGPRARPAVVPPSVDLDALLAELRQSLAAAAEAGAGPAAVEQAARQIKVAILGANELAAGTAHTAQLIANCGDNSLLRKEPAQLGGGSKARGKRGRKPGAGADADGVEPAALLPAAASGGKAKKPKTLRGQLMAMPRAPSPQLPAVPPAVLPTAPPAPRAAAFEPVYGTRRGGKR